jgi:hypothetical protein
MGPSGSFPICSATYILGVKALLGFFLLFLITSTGDMITTSRICAMGLCTGNCGTRGVRGAKQSSAYVFFGQLNGHAMSQVVGCVGRAVDDPSTR